MDQLSDSRQAGAEIEITPAMIDAGVMELCENKFGGPLADLVQDVFYAMMAQYYVSSKAS